ncbi:MAG: dephospho-CoA kinase [Thermodesulfobacteriaceae bacterium]|nr:dephospho-CoA kinase [Thermodesulfobacteriaceae bacterium]MDW8136174.1 dephospho-CoA kinase [Thermodesulfobacterium sp.]
MKKIGITGGIGTGKSTFLKVLQKLGFKTFSCDEIIKTFYQDPEIKEKVAQILGEEVLNPKGEIDKKLISKKILENRSLKEKLESFFHPLVKEELDKFLKKVADLKERIVFVEVPLLFEVGWDKFFDEVWVISCSPEVQLKRLLERGLSLEIAKSFIQAQLPLAEKEKRANRVFSSEDPPEKWEIELKEILKEYRIHK